MAPFNIARLHFWQEELSDLVDHAIGLTHVGNGHSSRAAGFICHKDLPVLEGKRPHAAADCLHFAHTIIGLHHGHHGLGHHLSGKGMAGEDLRQPILRARIEKTKNRDGRQGRKDFVGWRNDSEGVSTRVCMNCACRFNEGNQRCVVLRVYRIFDNVLVGNISAPPIIMPARAEALPSAMVNESARVIS
jgi:hypothetical protein